MTLWHLTRHERPGDTADWGQVIGMVVRASSEEEARLIAEQNSGFESTDDNPAWTNPLRSSCVVLDPDGPAEFIIRDGWDT